MKEVKNVLVGLVSIFVLLVVADWAVGTWSEKMYYSSKYGIFHRQIYCLQESEDEIVILGSSRAAHHYVPQIFEDSLGMTCFNAGSDGMCIYYHYAILSSYIYRNAIPKLVVLDIQDMDVGKSDGATFTFEAALDRLSPHYKDNSSIMSMFESLHWTEYIKLNSKTYRYNSKLVQLIKCNFIPYPENKGYEAVNGKLPDDIDFCNTPRKNVELEYEKEKYLIKLLSLCKSNNIPLVMIYSPIFYNSQSNAKEKIIEISVKYNVPYWDYSNNPLFLDRNNFRDIDHLNNETAYRWSSFIANKIKVDFYGNK